MNKRIDFKGIKRNNPETQYEAGDCEHIINMRHENGAWRPTGDLEQARFNGNVMNTTGTDNVFILKTIELYATVKKTVVDSEHWNSIVKFYNEHNIKHEILLQNEDVKNVLNINDTIIIITSKRIRYFFKKTDTNAALEIESAEIEEFSLTFRVSEKSDVSNGLQYYKYENIDKEWTGGIMKKESDRLATNYIRHNGDDFFAGCLILTHAIELYDGTIINVSPLQFVAHDGFYVVFGTNTIYTTAYIDLRRIIYSLTYPSDIETKINELISVGIIKCISVFAYHFDGISGENKIIGNGKYSLWKYICNNASIEDALKNMTGLYKIAEIKKIERNKINALSFDLTEIRSNRILERGITGWDGFTGNTSGVYNNMLYIADAINTEKRILNPFYSKITESKNDENRFWILVEYDIDGEKKQEKRSFDVEKIIESNIRNILSFLLPLNAINIKAGIFIFDKLDEAGHPVYRYANFLQVIEKTVGDGNAEIQHILEGPSKLRNLIYNSKTEFSALILTNSIKIKYYKNSETGELEVYSSVEANNVKIYTIQESQGTVADIYDVPELYIDNYYKKKIIQNENLIQFSFINNPYSFNPATSYRIGKGRILDFNVNLQELSQGQFGQYSPFIFTESGIYSLQRQNANVLFSNIDQISNDVISKANASFSTNNGIFFPSGGKLKMINGRQVTVISDDLRLISSKLLNDNLDYMLFLGGKDGYPQNCNYFAGLYTRLPNESFEEFLKNGVIGYYEKRKELIVSNPYKEYSYIYNIEKGYWTIRTDSFFKFIKNYPNLISVKSAPNTKGTDYTVMYCHDDEEKTDGKTNILIETKPINSSEFLTNYRRLILRMLKDFGSRQKIFSAAIFASNDTVKWNLIALQQINFSQINEQKDIYFGRGWNHLKYYKIVITGNFERLDYISHIDVDIDSNYNDKLR